MSRNRNSKLLFNRPVYNDYQSGRYKAALVYQSISHSLIRPVDERVRMF